MLRKWSEFSWGSRQSCAFAQSYSGIEVPRIKIWFNADHCKLHTNVCKYTNDQLLVVPIPREPRFSDSVPRTCPLDSFWKSKSKSLKALPQVLFYTFWTCLDFCMQFFGSMRAWLTSRGSCSIKLRKGVILSASAFSDTQGLLLSCIFACLPLTMEYLYGRHALNTIAQRGLPLPELKVNLDNFTSKQNVLTLQVFQST